ncbi:TPA: dicarboxylate/amino acid:cation symporter [Citrobacter amalonaticus]|uniref:Cation:dicarboxylase symporter family transporter n=1 Tax=Citrobacter telavivensis TaxID=2653932 RepID=A0A6L5E9V2_9ENTR|nr:MULTISPECIES: dicarboxylate/amino acid:cation symporter [unclassified Citrobacter]MPQ51565.1 cation:dicarboxylase symporter family transporter [Citrobacter telavivensis]HCL6625803.1 dicarboxylate/amino acid:cation symporter [Citrobacter amalonaticus]MDM2738143.1 dicarboxylate/amino acid:cation symporter [Citrobacter sp. Ct235]QFS71465.1 cation:dicarboxylase symporter family transporter [Citrobacter telavivensis]CAI9395947.1 C4-dicarboxylate transport protein [Citrobacter sp. T1.2D-1]
MANANKLTIFIVIFMLAGILSGAVIHSYTSESVIVAWSDNITLLTDIFLRLIKMVIAPLVFSTLTVGIMRLGETSTIGRVGGKAMIWFISSSILSILVGLFIVTLEQPGSGLNLAIPKEAVDTGLAVGGMSLKGFLSHTIPTSIVGAMANNEILQIVVFSMFFGIGGASLGEKFNAPLVAALDVVSHIMLKVTGYVMYVAPLAIFAAISSVIATEGLGILLNYASFIGGYYVAILMTCLVLLAVGYLVLKKEVFRLVSMLKDPVLVAFTTSSSEAAYPKTLEQLTTFGCSRNIVSFVLPIGYSFNLVGSMVYCSFASMFIAQAYNIHLSFAEISVLMLTLMLASKGIAGVPRSALVVLAATIPSFNIPVAGILLLMGIDHFLDMGRSAINVLGNGIATAMLAQNEGLLEERDEEEVSQKVEA